MCGRFVVHVGINESDTADGRLLQADAATARGVGRRRTLDRVLGTPQLVFLVLGTVIGSGIFVVPGAVLRQTGGHIGVALVVWAVGGVLSLLGALTYAELGALTPEAGGLYVYLRDAFGRFPAFLFGWTMFFVIGSGAVATLAVAATTYLSRLVPLTPFVGRVVSVGLIAAIAAINIRGTRQSAQIQDWMTVAKVAGVVLMSTALLLAHHPAAASTIAPWPAQMSVSVVSGAGLAMIGTLWAYEGWAYVTFSAGEARDPQRTLPRSLVLGTAALVVIYLLANVAYVSSLGSDAMARSDAVASDAMRAAFGPGAAAVVAALVLLSVLGAAHAVVLTTPRVCYAMARDGLFFERLAEIHPRYGTPALAIGIGATWAMVLAATNTFEQLFTYVVFSAWIFYGLGAVALFVYRGRESRTFDGYRVPGYPWTPAIFAVAAFALVANTLVTQPRRALVGLAIVLSGIPLYVARLYVARRLYRGRLAPPQQPESRPTVDDEVRLGKSFVFTKDNIDRFDS